MGPLLYSQPLNKADKILRLAFRSLMQHKLRAALSILGVICGVGAVLAMLSISEGAKRESLKQIEQLGTRNVYVKPVSLTAEQAERARTMRSQGLNTADAERIVIGCSVVEAVAYIKGLKASTVVSGSEAIPSVAACSPNYAAVLRLPLDQGRFISGEDVTLKNLVCVLGYDTAKTLGLNGQVGVFLRIEHELFKVIGILGRQDVKAEKSAAIAQRNYNSMIFIPAGTEGVFRQTSLVQKNSLPEEAVELVVQMKTSEAVVSSVGVIKRILEVSHSGVEDYQVIAPQELLRQAQRTQRTFNIILGSIAFVSLLVGGIGIMNIMLATVSERTREIGIRRALGATQDDIVVQFLAESVLLTLSGGVIGLFAGLSCVWLINALAGWQTAVTLLSLILSLFMSVLTGVFFGLYPAYSAAKMDPITALRHE